MAGQVMGYSVHPNSVRNYLKKLTNKNQTEIGKVIKEAAEVYMPNYITYIILLKCSAVGMSFNGPQTNCGIAHILGILLMNSYNTDIFLATTVICSLSTLNYNNTYKNIKSMKNTPDIHIIQGIRIKVMPKV